MIRPDRASHVASRSRSKAVDGLGGADVWHSREVIDDGRSFPDESASPRNRESHGSRAEGSTRTWTCIIDHYGVRNRSSLVSDQRRVKGAPAAVWPSCVALLVQDLGNSKPALESSSGQLDLLTFYSPGTNPLMA